ncbi:MAG: hypothetical protein AzoDbin1_04120 [Azoarcus sp.]|nr:hypothetical protein [Azoarcus sp.]
MARKITRPTALPAATDPAHAAAAELDVLHPDRTVVIGGVSITVREYGHIEWLRLLPAAMPLVDAIAGHLEAGRAPTYEDALMVLAENVDALTPLVAQAAGITPAAIEAMNPDDGELLLMTWWGVNGRFFIGRALNRVAVARAERRAGVPSAGVSSTPPSSPTDTNETTSPATPNAS